jgi:hypothetical protein
MLSHASSLGYTDIARLLLEAGANTEIREDERGVRSKIILSFRRLKALLFNLDGCVCALITYLHMYSRKPLMKAHILTCSSISLCLTWRVTFDLPFVCSRLVASAVSPHLWLPLMLIV